ncbi:AMP-binding protein [Nocardioides sp.]|uniref:AMP-binding protein n=1 Tax=Nocardioides sp. TaxID=35761 RepID=UPI0035161F90
MTLQLDPAPAIDSWLATYGDPDADAAALACDRHDPASTAFVVVDAESRVSRLTYGELADRSRRMAAVLRSRGVGRGDRVPVLMGKRPELPVTLVALWRLGAVHVPLFTAFEEGAILVRVEGAAARLVVTEPDQRHKLAGVPAIDVVEVGPGLSEELDAAQPLLETVAVGGEGAILQLFTSGTTGKPKPVVVPCRALASFHAYLHYSLDVSEDDVFWNAADPGWAYGLYYGLAGPLVAGRPNVLCAAGFSPQSMVAVIESVGVTNFAGSPTMYRALSKADVVEHLPLRCASSAGEPLTPDVLDWAARVLGTEVRDHYGQTELGMVICNSWNPEVARPVKPGSMGLPMPGYTAGIVAGQIAIDVAESPLLWFTGYDGEPEKSAERFTADGAWYLTADTGSLDDDGYFTFAARDDDVILAAGYRIGPFDIESVLITHAAVLDVAVVGRPDPEGVRGEQVEAFVVLADGAEDTPQLHAELVALVREGYSRHAYPRRIHVVDALPKTPSGKVQRYLLRAL